MADCAEGKKLTELRVIDLKTELEKRGLDKTGNKAALLERLAKAISDDGENPDEYLIVPSGGPKIAPKKIVDNLEPETQKDDNSENLKNSEPIIAETEKIVNNEILEEPVVNKQTEVEDCKETETTEPEINENCNNDTMKDKKEVDEAPSANQKIEKPPTNDIKTLNNEIKTTTNDAIDNSSTAETNGIDNEDSINLTIGEDEENLLGEETESSERQKDEPDAKKLEENNSNKKGDSKGSGRLENDSSNKEASPPMASTGPVAGSIKTQQDGDGSKSNDQSAKTPKSEDKDKKSQPSINATSRNLWVSGLSSTTRATDLKQIFSKYGKVIGAKVVTNARTPGARCYGYVTMSTSDDAAKCIQNLHRTELHGRVISVEKAKGDSQQNNRKREVNGNKENKEEKEKTNATGTEETEPEQKEEEKVEKNEESNKEKDPKDTEVSNDRENRESNVENKDEDSAKDGENRSTKSSSRKSESDRSKRDDKSKRSWDRVRGSRSRSREHHRRDNVLSFAKIKEERERQRIREKERMIREEKRRRNEEIQRTREIERRHREEEARLAREREKLRQERERIEQEKAELLRLERERQKMERDKLERERLEIKRQQMRLEETRRPPPPPSLKRSNPERRDQREVFEPERKRRHTPDDLSDRRRYESTARGGKDSSLSKDFKRSEFSRSSRAEPYTEPSSRNVRAINSIDSRQIKESRYERPSSTSFPRDREARRSEDGHRGARDHHNRYENSKPNSRDSRYVDNSRASGWHSGPPASKSFNPVNRNEQSSWGRGSDTRWGGSNSVRHPGPPIYQSNPIQSLGIPGSNSASYDRYDTYKSTVPNIRKY